MKPETEQNVNEAINWLQQTGGQIQNFAAEQAPIYCKEVIAWEILSGSLYASLGVVALLSGLWFAKCTKNLFNSPRDYKISIIPAMAATFLFGIGIMMLVTGASDAGKAITAPRLVIIDHLKGLSQ